MEGVRIARPAAVHVLGVVDDPRADAPRVASAIELDPALTAQIMRLANSAFYGMSGRVGNTGFAVTVIGFSAIRSLAALNATGLDDPTTPKPAQFWAHAAAAAAGCSMVAAHFSVPRNDAFAAGLLHDLGGALLHRFDRDTHQRLLMEHGNDSVELRDAEADEFGLGHDAAAARVLGAWRFPELFVSAVARHHEPSELVSDFDRVVAGGNALAELASMSGEGADDGDPAAHLAVLAAIGIEGEVVAELVEQTAERAAEISATLPSH